MEKKEEGGKIGGEQIRRNSEAPFLSSDVRMIQNAVDFVKEEDLGEEEEEEDEDEDMTTNDNDETLSEITALAAPPDGGWGWAVVFASFMIHIIADGITYTVGVFIPGFLTTFDVGRSYVSFIPSILVGVTLSVGPIASTLTNRFGCRVVTIVGAVLASLGFFVSAAAPGILFLYLSIGLITGIGFGFIYLPAIVSVSMYFEKKRAFATGIAVCGSGLGTFIFAPFTDWLNDNFGWRISFLWLGAIACLCFAFGCLFRPLPPPGRRGAGLKDDDEQKDDETLAPLEDDQHKTFELNGVLSNRQPDGTMLVMQNEEMNGNFKDLLPELRLNGEALRPIGHQFNNPATADSAAASVDQVAFSQPVLSTASQRTVLPFGSHSQIETAQSAANARKRVRQHRRQHHHHRHHHHHHHQRGTVGVMFRKDIFYGGSLYNIPEYRNNPKRFSREDRDLFFHHPIPPPPSSRCSSADDLENEAKDHHQDKATAAAAAADEGDNDKNEVSSPLQSDRRDETKWSKSNLICCRPKSNAKSVAAFKKIVTDLSLLEDSIFLLFAASNFLTSFGFNVPYVFTVDRAISQGMDKKSAAMLLSVIGIANTLGRIALGYLSDRPWINRLYLYNMALAICGINMGLSNFCVSFEAQAFNCAVFGVTSGAYVGLTSVVLVDLLGLDRLTNAFGLLLLCQGIASVIGPPIIGAFKDFSGDFDSGFYLSGSMIFVSGVMLFVLPWVEKRRELRKRNECMSA